MSAQGTPEEVRVNVRFFASLREAVSLDSLQITLDEATVFGARAKLGTLLPRAAFAALCEEGVQLAVNHTIVKGDASLAAGDELAFLPPVTGG